MDAIAGTDPFIMMADGKGWLYSPAGLLDGPMPTHYEPFESPVTNLLYPEVGCNPAALTWNRPDNPTTPTGDPRYPLVATTFRLTEHHTAGAMSRNLPWLAELQPEMFAEIDPMLAAERGIEDGGWMVIETERAEIEARARVTERMRPLRVDGRQVHQVALPWHWGFGGARAGRQRQRPRRARRRPERLDPGGQGVHLQRPRRPPHRRDDREARRACTRRAAPTPDARRPVGGHRDVMTEIAIQRAGRPADGLLHRHDGVHRLQGVRGGLQAVERPALRRRQFRKGGSYDHTGRLSAAPGGTCASSSSPTPAAASPRTRSRT